MPVTCEVCHAWRPKQWEGWRWKDMVAFCMITNRYQMHDFKCDRGALVAPKVVLNVPERNVSKPDTAKPAKLSEVAAVAEPNNGDTGEHSNVDPNDISVPTIDRLRSHQREAYNRFVSNNEIALFFEMGTGKSATILAIVGEKFRRGEIDALLIIAPNQVHKQWATQQIPLWLDCANEVQCLFGDGGAKEAYPFDDDHEMLQVVCVNIDTFSTPKKWQDIVAWANSRRTFIVLDEATVIKSVTSLRTQRLLYEFNEVKKRGKTILSSVPKSVGRAILTGTPVTNGPVDAWSIFEFLRPNYFMRNYYSFRAHFGMYTQMAVNDRTIPIALTKDTWTAIKNMHSYGEAAAVFGVSEDTFQTIHNQAAFEGPYKHADELKLLMAPVAMYKMLSECEDLPAQSYVTRSLQMPKDIKQCYDEMRQYYLTQYETHTATALNKLGVVMRLQQISSGFICDKTIGLEGDEAVEEDRVAQLYGFHSDEDILPNEIRWIGTSNPKLENLYLDIEGTTKPCIIITRFSAEASRIYNDLCTKYSCCLMTGWKRIGSVEDFQAGKYEIMVANIAVVARGFNLQNSHNLFFYSNTYSLELRLQAEGRIFRLGQKNPCLYTDYVYEGSIDEMVLSALRLKRNLLDFIRGAEVQEVIA